LDLLSLFPACGDHLKTYGLMDIALDTFPYAGTTTTCEALLMGVPVIVLRGKSNHAHNVGVSLLQNIGLPELIADTTDECVEIAVNLANDVDRLRRYRETIRPRMLASPLCDGATFTKNLEDAYRRIFRRWCDEQTNKFVEPFRVAALFTTKEVTSDDDDDETQREAFFGK